MLPILNGDATLALLKKSPVKGDFVVWKDMLMEGPVSANRGKAAKGKSAEVTAKSASQAPGRQDSRRWAPDFPGRQGLEGLLGILVERVGTLFGMGRLRKRLRALAIAQDRIALPLGPPSFRQWEVERLVYGHAAFRFPREHGFFAIRAPCLERTDGPAFGIMRSTGRALRVEPGAKGHAASDPRWTRQFPGSRQAFRLLGVETPSHRGGQGAFG